MIFPTRIPILCYCEEMIDDNARIRIIRAMLGLKPGAFATLLGVSTNTITYWENGRAIPRRQHRAKLAEVCSENRICFLPSGYPIPLDELLPMREVTSERLASEAA